MADKETYRRKYLISACAGIGGLFAGCSGETEDPESNEVITTNSLDDRANPTITDERGNPTTTGDQTSTEDNREPDIVISDTELVKQENSVVAKINVSNRGNSVSGPIDITAQWFDNDDAFLDDNWSRIHLLRPDETWEAEIVGALVDPGNVEDLELSSELHNPIKPAPGGMSVSQSQLFLEDRSTIIRGTAENNRQSSLGYITAIGRILNKQGYVLQDASTVHYESEIPAGSDWRFEISTPNLDRRTDIEERTTSDEFNHEVILSKRIFY